VLSEVQDADVDLLDAAVSGGSGPRRVDRVDRALRMLALGTPPSICLACARWASAELLCFSCAPAPTLLEGPAIFSESLRGTDVIRFYSF
jgi:hypothetical protein